MNAEPVDRYLAQIDRDDAIERTRPINEDPALPAVRKMVNELVKLVGERRAEREIRPFLTLSWYGMAYHISVVLARARTSWLRWRWRDEMDEIFTHGLMGGN